MLSGCLTDDSNEVPFPSALKTAVTADSTCSVDFDMAIQTVATDYSSSKVALGCQSEGGVVDSYYSNTSDFTISSGDKLYHLGRTGSHSVSQYDYENASIENWNYSTNDDALETTESNPYKVIEASATKAYIIRYNETKVWIVDPSAQNADDFKTGEIDLSHYAASIDELTATSVEMSDAILHDGKLFIAMQRLKNGSADRSYENGSKIAVYDISNDTEIDTTPSNINDEMAITLVGANVSNMSLLGDSIYIASRGNYTSTGEFALFGALEILNTTNYSLQTLVLGSEEQGHISDVAAIADGSIYFTADFSGMVNDEWVSKTGLYNFTGSSVTNLIDESYNLELPDIEKDNFGNLWVASANPSNPGIYRFDILNEEANLFMPTLLVPRKIVFRK